MYERDWKQFLEKGAGAEIAIAQIPHAHVKYLGANSEKLYLHHTYAMKAAEKHGLSHSDFALIFEAVEYGEAISDRPKHITYFFQSERRWYQVTIKCSGDTRKLYLATFHRIKERKVTNRKRNYPLVPK